MRPAQKAPENVPEPCGPEATASSFNEAGAKSAGKHHPDHKTSTRHISFNEAGAKSAGKPEFLPNGY